jgi:hypothetical protein
VGIDPNRQTDRDISPYVAVYSRDVKVFDLSWVELKN